MQNLAQLGLKARSIALCVVLLLGGVTAVCTALIKQHREDLLDELKTNTAQDARALALCAEPFVLLGDRANLGHTLDALASSNPTIVRASIHDAQGETWARYRRPAGNGPLEHEGLPESEQISLSES